MPLIHSILVLADRVSLAGWWALKILLLILPLHSAGIKAFGWHIWLLTNYFGSISSHFAWQTNIYVLQIKISPKPQNQKFIFIKKFFLCFSKSFGEISLKKQVSKYLYIFVWQQLFIQKAFKLNKIKRCIGSQSTIKHVSLSKWTMEKYFHFTYLSL